MSKKAIDAERVLGWWNRMKGLPGGTWLFSKALGIMIPYTGSVRPRVRKIEPGVTEISICDCRRIRNHLRSVHAIALANIGEFSGGLAVLTAVPKGTRFIITSLKIDYLKKARGTITARAKVPTMTEITNDKAIQVVSEIYNSDNEMVARTTAEWQLRKG
jgi:acyl-coenzyme A thioesterase PaaI-like protein